MLDEGITKDMFLVACDPNFAKLRYLVTISFSLLGMGNDILDIDEFEHSQIRSRAVASFQGVLSVQLEEVIEIILKLIG